MKALLMHPDRDFDLERPLPANADVLIRDLELDVIFQAMAGDDALLQKVARQAVLDAADNDVETVRYRQEVLRDCLAQPQLVRKLYDLTVETMERKRRDYWGFSVSYPPAILGNSIRLMQMFVGMLEQLRTIARTHEAEFASRGFQALFATLKRELDDDYLARVKGQLDELKFRHGVLISAHLGPGNQGRDYVLRLIPDKRPGWLRRLIGQAPREYTFHLPDRDEAGAQALGQLRDRGINLVANALAQATEHVLAFFAQLRKELGYYVCCLNLHERLAALQVPVCTPIALARFELGRRCSELIDPSLALTLGRAPVGNTADASGRRMVIVTGANQGGKSSFLRSIGLAQLMMQAGMFVAARSFAAPVCSGVFTHYKREEDSTMSGGKFDEELARMSAIAEHIGPAAMMLFNESFASTNELEGSEVARQVVAALLARRIEVFFVTHLYDFSHDVYATARDATLFLRAERLADGSRPFKLVEGEPLATSYGEDLYREVFADAEVAA
jgi:hypothetical protein